MLKMRYNAKITANNLYNQKNTSKFYGHKKEAVKISMLPLLFLNKTGKSFIPPTNIITQTTNTVNMQQLQNNIPTRNSSYFMAKTNAIISTENNTPISKQPIAPKNVPKCIVPKDMNSDMDHGNFGRRVCLDNPNACLKKLCDTVDKNKCTFGPDTPYAIEFLGNATSTPPMDKSVVKLSNYNYSGQQKNQYLVQEPLGLKIDKNVPIVINKKGTEYAQRLEISTKLQKHVPSCYQEKENFAPADYIPTNSSAADLAENLPKIYMSDDDKI